MKLLLLLIVFISSQFGETFRSFQFLSKFRWQNTFLKNNEDKFDKLSDFLQQLAESQKMTDQQLNKLADKTDEQLNKLADKTDEQLNKLADKTDEQLNKLTKSLKASQNRIDKQLEGLIGYNKNRDLELEKILSKTFSDFLKKNEWLVLTIDLDKIYSTDGREITEWDGIIYATHENNNPCLFFIEAKQLFTTDKLRDFYKRIEMMKNDVLPKLNYKDPNAAQIYKSMAKTLSQYLELSGNATTKVCGVIGSPNIEDSTKAQISASTSYVTLTKDVYTVVLQI
jgi:ElaB/YqjD/DUF883 family membrane-anchored ribosome-binding protein